MEDGPPNESVENTGVDGHENEENITVAQSDNHDENNDAMSVDEERSNDDMDVEPEALTEHDHFNEARRKGIKRANDNDTTRPRRHRKSTKKCNEFVYLSDALGEFENQLTLLTTMIDNALSEVMSVDLK